jgi:hypothetical protein
MQKVTKELLTAVQTKQYRLLSESQWKDLPFISLSLIKEQKSLDLLLYLLKVRETKLILTVKIDYLYTNRSVFFLLPVFS